MQRHGDHPVHLFPASRRPRLRPGPGGADLRSGTPRHYVQGVDSIFDLDWNGLPADAGGKRYRDVFLQAEQEFSAFNFEIATTDTLFRHFKDAEAECAKILEAGEARGRPLPLPAYDQCMKASHIFNLLDARGVISVTERQAFIGRVRDLAKACCEAWYRTQGQAGAGQPFVAGAASDG